MKGLFYFLIIVLIIPIMSPEIYPQDHQDLKGSELNRIIIASPKIATEGSWRTEIGGDLDIYVGWNGSPIYSYDSYSPPLDFEILVNEDIYQYENFTLILSALDVDFDGLSECSGVSEVDNVFFNGHYVGKLTGANASWSITTFKINKEWVVDGTASNPGRNKIEIYVDVLEQNTECESWAVQIDWGELTTENSGNNGVGFSTEYSDEGTDINNNGRFEYLDIIATVNVEPGNSGSFNMNGVIEDASGLELDWATNEMYLNSGVTDVLLRFDGKEINSFGIDGPYYLKNTTAYQVTNPNINGWIVDAHTTGNYKYSDFEVSELKPRVVEKIPNDGSIVSSTKTIKAVFSTEMLSSSINVNSFQVKSGTQQILGIINYDEGTKTATFLSDSLLGGHQYQAILSTDIKSISGQNLPYTEVWSFSISEDLYSYIPKKLQIITEILNFKRPLFNFPFYEETENQAKFFVDKVNTDYQAGNVDLLDLEAVARLTLSERVSSQAIYDANDISIYGAKGLKSLSFSWILKYGLQKCADLSKGIPFIGKSIASFLQKIIDKVSSVINKLNLAIANNLKLPPLFIFEKIKFLNLVQERLIGAEIKTAVKTPEIVDDGLNSGIFDWVDYAIQDAVFFSIYNMETSFKQNQALTYAKEHTFAGEEFELAHRDATLILGEMIYQSKIAKDMGRFVNTQKELLDYATIIGLLTVGLVALVNALFSGGSTAIAAIGAFGYIVMSYSALVSKGAAIFEATESLVYVDFILPVFYVNPSVDVSFSAQTISPKQHNNIPKSLVNSETHIYKNYFLHSEEMREYCYRLREMILSGDDKWATTGIDSLEYYEKLASKEEDLVNAELSASSDVAEGFIKDYRKLSTNYIMQSASRELYSVAIEFSAFQYRSGQKTPSVMEDALKAVDNAISNISDMTANRTYLYSEIESNKILIPNSIGLGKITSSTISKESGIVNVQAEVINYGNTKSEGIQIYSSLASEKATIIGDSSVVISLDPKQVSVVDFRITTTDSLLSGAILIRANSDNLYYALPGKSFNINITSLPPDNIGTLSNTNIYAYPNPFNPKQEAIRLRFKLASDGDVTIKIYDISNTEIKSVIVNEPMKALIEESIEWDGKDDNGNIISNGVYFYIIESTSGERAVGKIGVLK